MPLQTTTPLFGNDPIGFLKFLVAGFTVISPIFALLVWWLRRGPHDEIEGMKRDVQGIGEKVDGLDKLADRRGQAAEEIKERMTRVEGETKQTAERLIRVETDFKAMHTLLAENHRDMTSLMLTSAKQQMDAVNEVRIQIARLEERANIGDCLTQFGLSMERSIKSILEQTRS